MVRRKTQMSHKCVLCLNVASMRDVKGHRLTSESRARLAVKIYETHMEKQSSRARA